MAMKRKTKVAIGIVIGVVVAVPAGFVAWLGFGISLWLLNTSTLAKVQPGMTHAQVRKILHSKTEDYVELRALPRGDPFRTYDDASFLDPEKLKDLKIYRYRLRGGEPGWVAYDKAGRVAAVRKTHD